MGTFPLDRCARTLLVPLFDTDQDLLATFDPDGADRGAEVFEGFSARAVAHDGVRFRAYGVRAEDVGCEGVARFAVQDASTGAIVRTVDVAHDDWPRGTPAWRDGRWWFGGRCAGDVVTLDVDDEGVLRGHSVTGAAFDDAPWSAHFPLGSDVSIFFSPLAGVLRSVVVDPSSGAALSRRFDLVEEGFVRGARHVQAESDDTFGWAYERVEADRSSLVLVRFRADGTIVQREEVARDVVGNALWLLRWTGDGYALGYRDGTRDVIVRYACD